MTDAEPSAARDYVQGAHLASIAPPLRMGDAVRALAVETEAPRIEEMALSLAMADAVGQLWGRVLSYDAADPRWADRDRFVLSSARGAPMLRALLCLTGHDGMEPETLRAVANGHDAHPPFETPTVPPGQGLAMAVGMALAERMLAARFGKSLVDHRTWVVACERDLIDGVSHEAASLAGALRLERLAILYADMPDPACPADPVRRFAALGWATKQIDGHDPGDIAAALSAATRARKPTLIACRVRPTAPAAMADLPDDRWLAAGRRGASTRRAWLKRVARHPRRAEFERAMAGRLPDTWHETLAALRAAPDDPGPPPLNDLVGAADRPGPGLVEAGAYGGRFVPFAGRTLAMSAAVAGIALHGGLIPCGHAALAQADAIVPALRLAARMQTRVIHVLTDDGIGSLAALRAIQGLCVLRPADAAEAAECWDIALRRLDGPSVIVRPASFDTPVARPPDAVLARGGYVLAEAAGARRATIIAAGPDLAQALRVRAALHAEGIAAAVAALPCWSLFTAQDETYRTRVLGEAPRFGLESGDGLGWGRWIGPHGLFLGTSGAAQPNGGLTDEAVLGEVRRRIGS